jgi:hypothetical protein
VHVQQVEAVRPYDLVHAHGEREVVRRILEQGVSHHLHLVEVDAREERRQTERLLVGDEVHLVTAACERDPQLGRHGARAAVRRVAGDADLHVPSRHHRSAVCSQPALVGSSTVTASGGS